MCMPSCPVPAGTAHGCRYRLRVLLLLLWLFWHHPDWAQGRLPQPVGCRHFLLQHLWAMFMLERISKDLGLHPEMSVYDEQFSHSQILWNTLERQEEMYTERSIRVHSSRTITRCQAKEPLPAIHVVKKTRFQTTAPGFKAETHD